MQRTTLSSICMVNLIRVSRDRDIAQSIAHAQFRYVHGVGHVGHPSTSVITGTCNRTVTERRIIHGFIF